jgi:hypothetical protein
VKIGVMNRTIGLQTRQFGSAAMTFYDFDQSGELVECSHEFEIDLNCLVTTNYKITMEGIERAEDEAISESENANVSEDDLESRNLWVSHERTFYDGLKAAAKNFALVALIARLHHWVSLYARRLDPDRPTKPLSTELGFLNSELKQNPPFSGDFFRELITLRDSIVHRDSQPDWNYEGKTRRVGDRYVRGNGRVEINDEDLAKAIDAAVKQVKWYDERLRARGV